MAELWNIILYHPILNLLIAFVKLTGNLGWGIILLTIFLRLVLTPIILPGLKLSKKIQELAPELNKLKEKYKDDKTALFAAQTELYKQHGANPASGCIPQILQLVVLIALFKALTSVLNSTDISATVNSVLYSFNQIPEGFQISTQFLYMNLVKPDVIHVPGLPFPLPGLFLILAGLVQFISSKMMSSVVKAEKKVAEKSSESMDDAMVQAQEQMLYLFPLMTIIFGYQFPSGLVIYWFVFSLTSSIQQFMVTGWGGLSPWIKKVGLLK